jgi:DNA-binding transcriptional LysR family regulator
MDTRYLKTLVAAVEAGTFSRAAETLHITQSAVSQRIKFLEEHFSQQLLDRSGQRLTLTPAGKQVLNTAKDILQKEKDLLSNLQETARRKCLSLCCTPTFGMAYLPHVLNHFLRIHSDLSDLSFVFFQPQQALQGLQNEEFDLAVIEHRLDQDFSGFSRYSLPDDEMLLVASGQQAIPSENGVVALAALKDFRLYARRDGCSSKELMRQNLETRGLDFEDFPAVVVSDDLRYTIQSVLAGEGVAYLSRALVEGHLESGELAGYRVEGFQHRRGRSVVLLPQKHDDALLAELLESVFAVVSPHWRPQLVTATAI